MKKFSLLLVLIFTASVFITGCGGKKLSENSPFQITYEMKGSSTGKMDLTAKGGNAKIVVVADQSGMKTEMTMFAKAKDNTVYMIMTMNGQKVGLKYDITKDKEAKEFSKFSNIKEELKNYKKEGTEDVLGYKCDVYKKGNETICVYSDFVPLKITSDKDTFVATKFDPEPKIEDSIFDPPKDVEFKTMEDFTKDMMKGLENGLDGLDKMPQDDKGDK